MGFGYDENVQAAAFANRRRLEQITFIAFLVVLSIAIIIFYVAYRVIQLRRNYLKAQAAVPTQ